MLRLRLNRIEIATKGMAKIALLLSVYYPFITIPYSQKLEKIMWKV